MPFSGSSKNFLLIAAQQVKIGNMLIFKQSRYIQMVCGITIVINTVDQDYKSKNNKISN